MDAERGKYDRDRLKLTMENHQQLVSRVHRRQEWPVVALTIAGLIALMLPVWDRSAGAIPALIAFIFMVMAIQLHAHSAHRRIDALIKLIGEDDLYKKLGERLKTGNTGEQCLSPGKTDIAAR